MSGTKFIAFTGAQGTGKTTMRRSLCRYLGILGKSVIDNYVGVNESISRDAAKLGFKINLEANFESQYYMTTQYIAADLRTRKYAIENNIDYVITDRSILDVLPYSKMCKRINDSQYEIIQGMVLRHLDLFRPSLLLYCAPLDVLVKDENRSDDRDYQNKIDNLMLDNIIAVTNEMQLVTEGLKTDTVENRLTMICKLLEI